MFETALLLLQEAHFRQAIQLAYISQSRPHPVIVPGEEWKETKKSGHLLF